MNGDAQASGICWCGCGSEIPADSFFVGGHDLRAALGVIRLEYGDTANFLSQHGYSPDAKNLQAELEQSGS